MDKEELAELMVTNPVATVESLLEIIVDGMKKNTTLEAIPANTLIIRMFNQAILEIGQHMEVFYEQYKDDFHRLFPDRKWDIDLDEGA